MGGVRGGRGEGGLKIPYALIPAPEISMIIIMLYVVSSEMLFEF